MSPTSYQTAPPRVDVVRILRIPGRYVNPFFSLDFFDQKSNRGYACPNASSHDGCQNTVSRYTVEELIDRARRNEAIARKLFDIEVAIMNMGHSAALLERLLDMILERFQVDHAGFALIRAPHTEALVRTVTRSKSLAGTRVLVDSVAFLELTQGSRKPLLVNRNVQAWFPLISPADRPKCQSLAILPLTIDQRVVGGLTLGSTDKERYRPDKDSFFLYQLAVKTSLCLDAALNREKIQFLATRDPLTHLRNRRELEETLEQEITRAQRHKLPLALVFIDCDDFKQVNDTWGHDTGDLYLRHMAACLTAVVRKSDQVFRFAGDEFVVLLPSQDREGGEQFIQRLRQHLVKHPLTARGLSLDMKASAGLAVLSELSVPSGREMLKEADKQLYAAKACKAERFAQNQPAG